MNTKTLITGISTIVCLLFMTYPQSGIAQEGKAELNLGARLLPLSEEGIFRDPNYYHWGGSIIKGDDGLYHLFYSRWEKAQTFNGWLTASEIAHATSSKPSGPWSYKETVLKGRGKGHWDAITAHNPKIKYFEGKYYLYYIATNMGDQPYTDKDLAMSSTQKVDRDIWEILRANQRTGLAVANSLDGPWERAEAPLIEPSGPIANITVNPAIARGKDGLYYLIVKGDKPNETRFIRHQAIATAHSPAGPFTMQDEPVIDNLDTEDVSMFYDEQEARFYAIFHAHSFIGLMTSADGLHWTKAQNYKVTDKKVLLNDGSVLTPNRMERPFVYTEEDQAKVLCLAIKKGDDAYTIFIPLLAPQGRQ